MLQPSFKTKCLLIVFLFFFGSIKAQNLVKDSWENAGRWFHSDTYNESDGWYWALGLSAAGGAMIWDESIQRALSFSNPNTTSNLSPFMEPFGNPYYMGSAALALHFGALLTKDEELAGLSSTALQSMFTAGLSVMALKLLFHRIRPEEQALLDPHQFLGPSLSSANLSFPSGHSAIAFSLAASVSAYYDDPLYLALPLYTIASLTAWQRIYDQKHWPSDVIMGGLMGVFIGRKIARWQKERGGRISIAPCLIPNTRIGLAMRIPLDSYSNSSTNARL